MLLLPRKLLDQGFLVVKLKSSQRKFCGRQHDLVIRYGISVSQMTADIFHFSQSQSRPFFPYSWLIAGFVPRRVPQAENYKPSRSTWVYPTVLVWLV